MLLQCLQDFTSVAFKAFSVVLESHHIKTKTFEIKLLKITESLVFDEKFLEFTRDSNIYFIFFYRPEFLKIWKLSPNHLKLSTNNPISVISWKNLIWMIQHKSYSAFAESPKFHLYRFQGHSLRCLWKTIIFNRTHLKPGTNHEITGFWRKT